MSKGMFQGKRKNVSREKKKKKKSFKKLIDYFMF